MTLTDALSSFAFWAYAAAAAALLGAACVYLFFLRRRGPVPEDYRGVFWSWVLLVAILVAAVLLGHEAFILIVALISVFACREFARATGLYQDWIFTGWVYLAILVVNGVAFLAGLPRESMFSGPTRGYDLFMASPIYAVALLCILPVLRNRAEGMLPLLALAIMAFVYFGYFLAHLALLAGARVPAVYGYLFFMVFGTASTALAGWLADQRWGRHPIAPRISPTITWEGALLSLPWAALWCFSLGWTLPQPQFNGLAMLLAALLFGLLGPLADLTMRYTWRDLGLKARGDGVDVVPYLALHHLNRLIFVAPLFYRLVRLFNPEVFV